MTATHPTNPQPVPTLDPGLTLFRSPGPRTTAIHRVVLATLAESSGLVYWLDARNVASTYTLYDLADSHRRLRRLRIARAFTAYQHHALGRELVERVDGRTGLLVAPNVTALYRDDDVPRYQRDRLLESTVRSLSALASGRSIPVVLTVPEGRDPGPVADHADQELWCERTDQGYRFVGPDTETTVYWCGGYWQTTIPYWVELLGAVSGADESRVHSPGTWPTGPAQVTLDGSYRGES